MEEALLSWHAKEACSSVNLAETTVLDEKESLFVEMPTDFENYAFCLGLDYSIRISPRMVYCGRNLPRSDTSSSAKTWLTYFSYTLIASSTACLERIRGELFEISLLENEQWDWSLFTEL